ncbi:MAG: SMC-Scp complex subunit ScpB [Persicimonas sp.]
MSETSEKPPGSTPPTPEAHGNREEKGSSEPVEAQPQAEKAEQVERADANKINAILEAIFFASDDPLTLKTLEKCLPEVEGDLVKRALENLRLEYSGTHRGIHLAEVAGGFQMRTNPDFKDHILEMYEARPRKLSRAAMETLAIVAYQQPLTRADVEEIRGVDSSGVIRTLEDHDLVKTIGRLDDLGRPHIYGTTERFLEFFGLDTLSDLPALDESELESLEEMYAEELEEFEKAGQDKASQDVEKATEPGADDASDKE